MVRYPSDEHDEGQDKNDDAVGNRYADAIGVGQEACQFTFNAKPLLPSPILPSSLDQGCDASSS
jgi:hypothetical protein